MESWVDNIDREVLELIREIGATIHADPQDVVAIAVALLAARMRIPVCFPLEKAGA